MKILARIWDEIRQGENIDLYVTIVFAISLAILNIAGVSLQSFIFPTTLALLALIAVSMLGNRNQVEDLINRTVTPKHTILTNEFPFELRGNIEKSNILWIIGISALGNLQEYYPILERKLKEGHHVKVLLVDPNCAAYEIAAMRDIIVDIEYQRSRVNAALKYLSALEKITPSHLEVRMVQYLLDFEMIITDVQIRQIIYLRHFGFRTPLGTEPKLVIDSKESEWFSYFTLHVQNIWENGVEWKSGKDSSLDQTA